jgi:MGT family glycosyltransferase
MAMGVFFNVPAHGHINPTLPVVHELVQRGETIIYYAMEGFRDRIEATGARFRDYGDLSESVRFEFGTADRQSPSLIELSRAMIEFCERSLPYLLEATQEDGADYIVHDFTCLWGKVVAELLHIPAIATIPQFPVNRKRRPEPYPGMLTDTVRMALTGIPSLLRFRKAARRISQRYGMARMGLLDMLAVHEEVNIVFTSRAFQPYADDFDERFLFVGPSIAERDESLDFALAAGPGPLVYISLGTLFNVDVAFYRTCLEAFGDTGERVVLSVGTDTEVETLGPIPRNVVVRNYVPQLEVLRRADAFITHGGMNSVSEALWYGVPLVVIPQAADQFFVAQRVEALRTGVVLDKRRVTPKVLREAVMEVLADENLPARCQAIGDSFREAGGCVRAADEILRAASQPR